MMRPARPGAGWRMRAARALLLISSGLLLGWLQAWGATRARNGRSMVDLPVPRADVDRHGQPGGRRHDRPEAARLPSRPGRHGPGLDRDPRLGHRGDARRDGRRPTDRDRGPGRAGRGRRRTGRARHDDRRRTSRRGRPDWIARIGAAVAFAIAIVAVGRRGGRDRERRPGGLAIDRRRARRSNACRGTSRSSSSSCRSSRSRSRRSARDGRTAGTFWAQAAANRRNSILLRHHPRRDRGRHGRDHHREPHLPGPSRRSRSAVIAAVVGIGVAAVGQPVRLADHPRDRRRATGRSEATTRS